MVFLKSFLSLHDFWAQKCKIKLFEENKHFGCSFYQIRVVIANLPSRLEKTPFTRHFAYDGFFMNF